MGRSDTFDAVAGEFGVKPYLDRPGILEKVLDVLPGHPRIGVASPCSGHGFTFGPVFGEIMVDLVTTGTSRYPAGPFRLDRFLPDAA